MKFKVGQKVKCINNKRLSTVVANSPPLKLGGIYIIKNISNCECGAISFDVGIINEDREAVKCYKCPVTISGTYAWFVASIRFESAEENDLQKELEEAVEEENYELAEELKIKINKIKI